MLRKLIPLLVILFLVSIVGSAMAQTEDEIIAKYLKKTEKKHRIKVGFISGHFSYGKLSNEMGYYRTMSFTASSELSSMDGFIRPHAGLYRSKEFGLSLGMMFKPKVALNLGFDYWWPFSTDFTVDLNSTFGVLEESGRFINDKGIKVYGFKVGFDYYLINEPDKMGVLHSLAVKAGGGMGYYKSSWNLWEEGDESSDPVNASAPGFWVKSGVEYPLGFLDMVIAADMSYFYLNFSGLESYNESGGNMTLSYAGDGREVEFDFSGLRGNLALKKFIRW